jgi:hypothetical protein
VKMTPVCVHDRTYIDNISAIFLRFYSKNTQNPLFPTKIHSRRILSPPCEREQGWVKAEAGPPGIKQLHRRGRRQQRRSRCGRRGRQVPRPPPIGKGTEDAGARAESAARALPSRHGRCRERPTGHVHGTASGRFVPRPTASATIAGWLAPGGRGPAPV